MLTPVTESEQEVNTRLAVLRQQRNDALDMVAYLNSQIAVFQDEITTLKGQLEELQAKLAKLAETDKQPPTDEQ